MSATRSWADRGSRPRSRPRATRAAALGILGLSPLIAESSVAGNAPQSQGATDGLTIAIVDLREMSDPRPPPLLEERRPAWRTTFGSERATPRNATAEIDNAALAPIADADVVLIQGVKASAPLRRLFQPRFWRLIISRKVLSSTDPVGFRTVRSDLPFTTAIAVKARKDLRITARAFALALRDTDRARAPDPSDDAAATAVRLTDERGRTVWLASVALPPSCGIGGPPCPAIETLDAWRREKREHGAPALIGVRIAAGGPAGQDNTGPCTAHTVESDLAWERLTTPTGVDLSDPGTGCISIVRLRK